MSKNPEYHLRYRDSRTHIFPELRVFWRSLSPRDQQSGDMAFLYSMLALLLLARVCTRAVATTGELMNTEEGVS